MLSLIKCIKCFIVIGTLYFHFKAWFSAFIELAGPSFHLLLCYYQNEYIGYGALSKKKKNVNICGLGALAQKTVSNLKAVLMKHFCQELLQVVQSLDSYLTVHSCSLSAFIKAHWELQTFFFSWILQQSYLSHFAHIYFPLFDWLPSLLTYSLRSCSATTDIFSNPWDFFG